MKQFNKGDVYVGTRDCYGNIEEPINFYIQEGGKTFKTLVDTPTRYAGEYYIENLDVYTDLRKIDNLYA